MIDVESDSGSWKRDWDSKHHTSTEYQQRINDLEKEISEYKKAMEKVIMLARGKIPNEKYLPDQVYEILCKVLRK